jgi:hypothetical protein
LLRKSSGNSIDALVKKQLTPLRQADTLFKDAVSVVELYRKKHPELDQYIPSVESTQREITVRGASSEDANSHVAGQRAPGSPKRTETLAGVNPPLDGPVVLLQDIIEVRHRPVPAAGVQCSFTLELSDRGRVSRMPIGVTGQIQNARPTSAMNAPLSTSPYRSKVPSRTRCNPAVSISAVIEWDEAGV